MALIVRTLISGGMLKFCMYYTRRSIYDARAVSPPHAALDEFWCTISSLHPTKFLNTSKVSSNSNLRICQVKMILLNIITAAYFISLIVMTFWTNIRPSYVNYWNKTEYLMNLKNQTKTEVDDIDVIMAANQVVIAVLGKFL